MLGPWDQALFRWINAGWSSPLLDQVFWFFSMGIKETWVRVGLAGVFLFLLIRRRARAAAIQAMFAWPLANELADVFKHGFQAARPHADAIFRVSELTSYGTMSAHAATMAAVATVMTLRLGRWGLPWILVAFLTGLSRVYVGVHYPSQVALGWLGGFVCGWVIVKTWDAIVRLRRRRAQRTG
ncbi:MAG: phosphatase PAP2 family protein [Armatimonadetes bacterium]|nr:phosphatase PAP2 family protein [Armatimonadota bacterium]